LAQVESALGFRNHNLESVKNADLGRVSDYGRMLASLGINGCAINNVNSDPRILSSDFIAEAARVAAAVRPWGVRPALAVDFGSPKNPCCHSDQKWPDRFPGE
jgi:alpha-glucuronidase